MEQRTEQRLQNELHSLQVEHDWNQNVISLLAEQLALDPAARSLLTVLQCQIAEVAAWAASTQL